MKAIVTIIFILFIGLAAQAQNTTENIKVVTEEYSIDTVKTEQAMNEVGENTVARLYKRKNTRVKKELTFTTKANRAKLS